jgi:hypothetical protein
MLPANDDLIATSGTVRRGHAFALVIYRSEGMIMQTITKHNYEPQQPAAPPIPPPAHFDEHEMAIAKPVQPLPNRRWHRQATNLRSLFFRHVNLFCLVIAAFAICGVLANTFADMKSSVEVARDERAEPVDDSTPEASAAEASPMIPALSVARPHARIRNHSIRRVRRPMPVWDLEPPVETRPRLVGTIHQ